MALVKCSECGKEVSTKAEQCPHCGAPVRKKTSGCAILAAVLFGLVLLGAMLPTCSRTNSDALVTVKTDAETRIANFNAAKAKFDASIEQRYAELLNYIKTGDNAEAARTLRQFESFKKTDYKDVKLLAVSIHTAEAVARLGKLAANDTKGRADTYGALARLHPENHEYAEQSAKYFGAWKREQAVIAEREKQAVKARR